MSAILNTIRHRSGESGFTLLEVMFSLVIASIGLLGLAMMQGTTIRGNSNSNRITTATILAQDKLEEFNTATENPDNAQAPNLATGDGSEKVDDEGTIGKGIFTRSWVVAEHTKASRLVTVTVAWSDDKIGPAATGGKSTNHAVVLSTITRGGQN